jgi:hypothetical protein
MSKRDADGMIFLIGFAWFLLFASLSLHAGEGSMILMGIGLLPLGIAFFGESSKEKQRVQYQIHLNSLPSPVLGMDIQDCIKGICWGKPTKTTTSRRQTVRSGLVERTTWSYGTKCKLVFVNGTLQTIVDV